MGKGADKPLLVIQNVNKLRLSLSVPEANTPYLHLGDTVKFRVRSIPQKMYMAKITRKTGALDSKLRSEKIEADFINMNNTLKPLMVAEATIPLKNTEPTFFVPKTALLDANMGMYIIRVENGKTKKVPVTRGRMMADKVEVFGELMEGEQILVKGSEEIEDGTSIKNNRSVMKLTMNLSIAAIAAVLLTGCATNDQESSNSVVNTDSITHKTLKATRSFKKGDRVPNDEVCMVNNTYMGKNN